MDLTLSVFDATAATGRLCSPVSGARVANPIDASGKRAADILRSLPKNVQDVILALPSNDQEIAAYAIMSLQNGATPKSRSSLASSSKRMPTFQGLSVRSPKSPRLSIDGSSPLTRVAELSFPSPSSKPTPLRSSSPGLPPLSPLRQARSVPSLTVIPPPSPAYSSSNSDSPSYAPTPGSDGAPLLLRSAAALPGRGSPCPAAAFLPTTPTPRPNSNSTSSTSTPRSARSARSARPPLSPLPPSPTSTASSASPVKALRGTLGGMVGKKDYGAAPHSASPRLSRTPRALPSPKNLVSPRPRPTSSSSPSPSAPRPSPRPASSGTSASPPARSPTCGGGAGWRPQFECTCFRCYRFFWSRWDASPFSAAINDAVTLYESSHPAALSPLWGAEGGAGLPKTPNPSPASDSGEVAPAPPSPAALARAVGAAGPQADGEAGARGAAAASRLCDWVADTRVGADSVLAAPSAAASSPRELLYAEMSLASLLGAESSEGEGGFFSAGSFFGDGTPPPGEEYGALEGGAGGGDDAAPALAGEPSLSSLMGSDLGQELEIDLGAELSLEGILEEGWAACGPSAPAPAWVAPAGALSAPGELAAEASTGSLASEPSGQSVHSTRSEPARRAEAWGEAPRAGTWAAVLGGTWPGPGGARGVLQPAAAAAAASARPTASQLDVRAPPFQPPVPAQVAPPSQGEGKRKTHRRGVASTAKARLRRHMRRRALLEQAQAVASEICGEDGGAPSWSCPGEEEDAENDPLSTMSARGAGAEAATGLPLEAMLGGAATVMAAGSGSTVEVVPESVASAWRTTPQAAWQCSAPGGAVGGASLWAGGGAAWGCGISLNLTWPPPAREEGARAGSQALAPPTPTRAWGGAAAAWGH